MAVIEEFVAAYCAVLLESAPLVVLGFVIAGLLHEFVPAALLRRRVGGRRLAPVARVVGVGALLPICSCSTIPLGIGLTRSGASIGTALAFMTSSPAISPVSVALGLAVLGPVLLGWYSVVAIAAALCIGVVGNRWLGETVRPEAVKTGGCGCGCGAKPSTGGRLARAMRWSFGDLGVEISASLAIGLLVASLVLVALPDGVMAGWLGKSSWLALLAAVAVSLPAYTCSVPSIVIAGSLLARGVDPGVAIAFLIAGPATNLGELNAIRGAMGVKAAAFYGGSLIAIALAAGAATTWLPAATVAAADAHAGHNHTHTLESVVLSSGAGVSLAAMPAWRWPFAACIVALAACSAFRRLRKVFSEKRSEARFVGQPQTIYGAVAK